VERHLAPLASHHPPVTTHRWTRVRRWVSCDRFDRAKSGHNEQASSGQADRRCVDRRWALRGNLARKLRVARHKKGPSQLRLRPFRPSLQQLMNGTDQEVTHAANEDHGRNSPKQQHRHFTLLSFCPTQERRCIATCSQSSRNLRPRVPLLPASSFKGLEETP